MISILIPTYNWNALLLVNNIYDQLKLIQIPFEIICLNDGSISEENKYNEAINSIPNARFESLPKNIGRSAIRNELASRATYEWLLFLDADVIPVRNDFIKKYVQSIENEVVVSVGGIAYQNLQETKPLLRYQYGKKYEEVSIKRRKYNPSKYFFTANFLIKASVFHQVKFEEKLTEYGREDLLFSIQLKQKGYAVTHLDNPVFHL